MTATATTGELLTLPEASVRTGLHIDRLRRIARRPEVARLFQHVGHLRVIAAADLDKLRVLAAAK